jgi:hypothetical protein
MKKVTKSIQPDKAELNTEPQMHHSKKPYQNYKHYDTTHGRVNKNHFGINHEPGTFNWC